MPNTHHLTPVITIDGPTGSGKGTVSRLLSERLGWHLLDSGAIYRVFALASLEEHIPVNNVAALAKLARHLKIEFISDEHGRYHTRLDERDVTEKIRQEAVGNQASRTSLYPEVREALMECQRSFRRFPGLVADGRDMGTVVFSDAEIKIFLSASAEERAKRRFMQLHSKGVDADLDTILAELQERDHRDQSRTVAPLKPAADAVLLDSTDLNIEQVVHRILELVRERLAISI